jgi:hypothetical protein
LTPSPAAASDPPSSLMGSSLPDNRGHRHGAAAFRVETLSAARFRERSAALIDAGAPHTVFQKPQWLDDWLTTLGQQPGFWPIFVAVSDASRRADVLLLPLIAQRQSGVTMLRSPDLGVADYNWPLVVRTVRDEQSRAALWEALKPTLARRGDVLRLAKMLPECDGLNHPLVGPLPVWPSESAGHHFDAVSSPVTGGSSAAPLALDSSASRILPKPAACSTIWTGCRPSAWQASRTTGWANRLTGRSTPVAFRAAWPKAR